MRLACTELWRSRVHARSIDITERHRHYGVATLLGRESETASYVHRICVWMESSLWHPSVIFLSHAMKLS